VLLVLGDLSILICYLDFTELMTLTSNEELKMSKVILITGGSRGLGRSGALALAEKGISVVLTYHKHRAAAEEVVNTIKRQGGNAAALQCDIRDLGSFEKFATNLKQVLKQEFSRTTIDYLLNNAGTGIHSSIEKTSFEELDDMLNIHVKGPYFLTQTLLPLIETGGHVVNVSSGLTRFSFPGSAPYAMAKGAVEVMTRYMAKEFANRDIRVNTLAPGAIATDFRDGEIKGSEQAQQLVASVTALGRVGEADDIGKTLAAMFSDGFQWITGQRIEASGGMFL
jgi:NAD(P)-dependent dehydrogenase (short-subunit alcohol dehydrogenase family)